MATRRRRTAAAPQPIVEPTHEEMLEVATEREEVAKFLEVMAEEAFSDLGEQDFFEPTPPPPAPTPAPIVEEIRHPAVYTGEVPKQEVVVVEPAPRFIPRKQTRRRKT